MNDKDMFSTDFLFTTPSFLTGAATVFNLEGDFYEYNVSASGEEADCKALKNDFSVVGEDLKRAVATTSKSF